MRLLSVCDSEHDAAAALGYTQVSWENLSGQEQQPYSSFKSWSLLRDDQKAAAAVLEYNQTNWDNKSGMEPQPTSVLKSWAELTVCDDGEDSLSQPLGLSYLLVCSALIYTIGAVS